jgi:hypothetical protein
MTVIAGRRAFTGDPSPHPKAVSVILTTDEDHDV